MAYDGEVYTDQPQNVAKLIDRLKSISDRDYEWCDPYACVVGYAERLRREEIEGCCDFPRVHETTFEWLGLSLEDGKRIYMDPEFGGKLCKNRIRAIRFLSRLQGMPKKSLSARIKEWFR